MARVWKILHVSASTVVAFKATPDRIQRQFSKVSLYKNTQLDLFLLTFNYNMCHAIHLKNVWTLTVSTQIIETKLVYIVSLYLRLYAHSTYSFRWKMFYIIRALSCKLDLLFIYIQYKHIIQRHISHFLQYFSKAKSSVQGVE